MDKRLCGICNLNEGNYICPKCKINYCNLQCYSNLTKHAKCSEDFYRDQVLAELKEFKIDDKKSVVEILKRVAKENEGLDYEDDEGDSEEDEDDEGETLVENEDLNNPETQKKLIDFYQNQIKEWKPWWLLSQDVLIQTENFESNLKLNDNLIKNTKALKLNEKCLNNFYVFNDLTQIIYVYVLLTYVYQDDPVNELNVDLCLDFINVEENVLKKNLLLSLKDRIGLIQTTLLNDVKMDLKKYFDKEFLIRALNDLVVLFEHKKNLFQALSYLYDYFCGFVKTPNEAVYVDGSISTDSLNVFHLKNKNKENGKSAKTISDIKKSGKFFLKRIEFYYAWLLQHDDGIVKHLLNDSCVILNNLKDCLLNEYEQAKNEKEFIEKNLSKIRDTVKNANKTDSLIEEL